MEPCVSCIYLTYFMEYVWKSSFFGWSFFWFPFVSLLLLIRLKSWYPLRYTLLVFLNTQIAIILIKIIEFSLWQVINTTTFSNVFFWWFFNWWATLKNLSFDPFTSCEIDTGAWNGPLRFCSETDISTSKLYKERIKGLREWIPHIGPLPIVIPLKIFLDLLWGLLFPRGLRRGGRRRCPCETAWMTLK